jgi:hypothetical protein
MSIAAVTKPAIALFTIFPTLLAQRRSGQLAGNNQPGVHGRHRPPERYH